MPIYNFAHVVSAYLNENCQCGQAIRLFFGCFKATVFRIVVHDVHLWGQEKVSQGRLMQTSNASGFQNRRTKTLRLRPQTVPHKQLPPPSPSIYAVRSPNWKEVLQTGKALQTGKSTRGTLRRWQFQGISLTQPPSKQTSWRGAQGSYEATGLF